MCCGRMQPPAIIQCTPFLTQLRVSSLPQHQDLVDLESLTKLNGLCSLEVPNILQIPDHCLLQLSSLTSLKIRQPSEGLTLLTGLRDLHLSSSPAFWLFPESFSIFSNLTYLEAGSRHGTNRSDILSVKVFPNLQKLTLNGPVKELIPGEYPGRLRRWDALTTLNSISDLELHQVDHTCNVFCQLGILTQLTRLWFCSNMYCCNLQELDQHLLNLSSLTMLRHLTCLFRKPSRKDPQMKSDHDCTCGTSLRATMARRPQVNLNIRFY